MILRIPQQGQPDRSHRYVPLKDAGLCALADIITLSVFQALCRIPKIVFDPPPAAFILACLIYASTLVSFYQLHQDDRYQRWFLLTAVCAGACSPLINFGSIKTCLPISVAIAQWMSAFAHCLYPRWRLRRGERAEAMEKAMYASEKHGKQTDLISLC